MATSTTNLEQVIEQAITTQDAAETQVQQTTETQESSETVVSQETGGETSGNQTQNEFDEFGLTAAQQIEARRLFAGLNNQQSAPLIVDALARAAGYQRAPETKQEVKEQKKEIKEVIKEKLGPELAFLADKLGPAIEEVLNERLNEAVNQGTADIRQATQQQQLERAQQTTLSAIDNLGKTYFKDDKVPDNLISEMNSVMNRLLPTPGMAPQEYIKSVMHAAAGNLGIVLVPKKTQERIAHNRNHVPSRVQQTRSGGEPQKIQGSSKLSLTDSIKLAIEQTEQTTNRS